MSEIKEWKLAPEPSAPTNDLPIGSELVEEPGASVGEQERLPYDDMGPVAEAIAVGQYEFPRLQWKSANHSLSVKLPTDLYTADQLATLQTKLEQAEKDKADLRERNRLLIEDAKNCIEVNHTLKERLRASNEAKLPMAQRLLELENHLSMMSELSMGNEALVAAQARIAEFESYDKAVSAETEERILRLIGYIKDWEEK